MKFHILTFGCQMNYADSARIKAVLLNSGWKYTPSEDDANIIIIDTCSVRQKSEDKVTWLLKQIPKDKKIWITWCMVQHNLRNAKLNKDKLPENLRKWNFFQRENINTSNLDQIQLLWLSAKEVKKFKTNDQITIPINNAFNDLFTNLSKTYDNLELMMRIDDIWFLPIIAQKLWYKIDINTELLDEYENIIPEWINTSMNSHNSTAYVPISTGCNQFCSYCIVPYARGLEKNYDIQNIVKECKSHIENWAKEIVLLWQIVNKHPQFVEILQEVLKIPGLEWLRYTSPYPTHYSPELLKLHEDEEKLCPHIHIPFQSWSDKILKKMFRWYSKQQTYDFIDKIRSLKRNISITTDIIVWFTDEEEQDFQETLDLVEYWKFDMIFIWIYSPRPWTYAAKNLQDNITAKEKQKRRDRLNTLLNQCSKWNNTKEIWNIRKVMITNYLWQSKSWENKYEWYTDNMKQIILKSKNNPNIKPGEFVSCKVTDGFVFKLSWEIL